MFHEGNSGEAGGRGPAGKSRRLVVAERDGEEGTVTRG